MGASITPANSDIQKIPTNTIVIIEKTRSYNSRHHIWWPRTDYLTRLERSFRNHPLNSATIDIRVHELIHEHTAPPKKPSISQMQKFLKENPRTTNTVFPIPKPIPQLPQKPRHSKECITIVLRTPKSPGEALRISCAECGNNHCFRPVIEPTKVKVENSQPRTGKKTVRNHHH